MLKLFLCFFGVALLSRCVYSTTFTITCPKAFRLGAEETVILNLHGYTRATVTAYMRVTEDFGNTGGILVSQNNASKPIKLPMKIQQEIGMESIEEFSPMQKVTLVIDITNAQPASGNTRQEFPVLVGRDSGYLFVITDQPVYKPNDRVKIKVFTLNQEMAVSDMHVKILIKSPPDNIGVSSVVRFMRNNQFVSSEYLVDENPVFGIWTVEVTYIVNGYETTAERKFLVERFVLPTFDVTAVLNQKYILANDDIVRGTLYANYSFGEPVTGSFILKLFMKKTADGDEILVYSTATNNPNALIAGGRYPFTIQLENRLNSSLSTREALQQMAANGGFMYIKAAVREQGSGTLENYASPNIPIFESPYVIDTKRTSIFFIHGVPFTLQAEVLFALGRKPATDVPYKIFVDNVDQIIRDGDELLETTTDRLGHINHALTIESGGNKNVVIRVGNGGRMTETHLTFRPYASQGSKYLLIELPTSAAFTVRDNMRITFSIYRAQATEIRFFILSRGSIVHYGTRRVPNDITRVQQNVQVTQNMIPSGRIVAYFMVGTEIVANSLWFDVVDQCRKEVETTFDSVVAPKTPFALHVRGSPNSWVSISAVDKAAYFLFNDSRLTRQTMFDKMENFDQGCSRSGGANTESVFWEAGLILKSNNYRPKSVDSLTCPERNSQSRKKRQAAVGIDENDIRAKEIQKCFKDGELDGILPQESCEARLNRVRENSINEIPELAEECMRVFLNSCRKATAKRARDQILNSLGRSSDVNVAELDTSLNDARRKFDPNMIFRNVRLDRTGRGVLNTQSSHSISTFEIDAVNMRNQINGFCIADTKTIKVFKDFFIQVITPYSLKVMEQANLRIVIFNYGDSDERISLDVQPGINGLLCTHFKAGDWSPLFNANIESRRSASTILTVLPIKLPTDGETASVSFQIRRFGTAGALDKITKEILIEESGEIHNIFGSNVINVINNRNQEIPIRFNFPEKFVPESRQCWIYAYSNLLGPSIEIDEINSKPNDVKNFFRQPGGCGEQNMIYSSPNVYAHMYLVAAGEMAEDSAAYRESILRIKSGYARELGYLSNAAGINRRAFSVFVHYQPSTWLNAFVDKVFAKANEYVTDMNIQPICTSLEWLLSKQHNDGYFVESGRVIHREMHGAVTAGGNNYLTLTAYVVISLLEAPSRCPPLLNERIRSAAQNGVNYLIRNKNNPTFSAPYGLSLLTYALVLQNPNSPEANEALDRLKALKLEEDGVVHWEGRSASEIGGTDLHAYWYNARPLAVYVEATAYALLAIITKAQTHNPPRQEDLNLARSIVLWLIQQRNSGGGFTSTQDTVIGLQALSTYQKWIASVDTNRPETDFTVQLSSSNVATGLDWESDSKRLTRINARYRVEFDIPSSVTNNLNVLATINGAGEGFLSYRCIYRTVVDEESCHFNITSQTEILNSNDIEQIKAGTKNLKLRMTLRASARRNPTEMSIIEVGMLSGFAPIERTLIALLNSGRRDGIVDRYEISDVNVVFYIREIPVDEPVELVFDMEQKVYIPLPEPAKIYVYDYYEPSIHCGEYYSITNTTELITSGCAANKAAGNSDICKCAEGGCMTCRNRREQVDETCSVQRGNRDFCGECPSGNCTNIWKTACGEGIDYAYEITVASIDPPTDGDVFYSVGATVRRVHRTGSHENFDRSDQLTFLVRRDCFENCKFQDYEGKQTLPGIKEGAQLLVIGSAPEKIQRNDRTIHKYRLGDNSLIERVIPQKACRRYKPNKCAPPNSPAETKKCKKQRLIKEACRKYRAIRRILNNDGCD